jgi:hypothetical protein
VYFNIVEPSDFHEASGCWGGDRQDFVGALISEIYIYIYICDFVGVGLVLVLLVWYIILHGSSKTNMIVAVWPPRLALGAAASACSIPFSFVASM